MAVVAIHTCGGNSGKAYVVAIRPFINFAVGLFVFLSGLLTKENPEHGYKAMILRRIKKVFIPYLVWSLIFSFLTGTMDTFLHDVLLARCSYGIYYFIFVYIQMAILTPAVFWLWNSRYKFWGWLVTPITVILVRYLCVLMKIPVGFPLQGELFTFWFIFYYLGIGLGNGKIKLRWTDRQVAVLYLLSIVLQEIEGYIWYFWGSYDLATTQLKLSAVLTTSLLCVMVFANVKSAPSLDKRESFVERGMVLFGNCSFGIYMSHMIIIKIMEKMPIAAVRVFPVHTLLVLAMSVVAVMLGKKILGKYAFILGL